MNDIENNDFKTEKFEEYDITVIIDDSRELWFRLIDIAKALEYKNPKHAINMILDRNAKYFTDKIKTFPNVHGGAKENRFLPEVEANFFVICSQQPKAKKLQYRLAEIAKSHRVMTSSLADPLQQGLAISKQLVKVFEKQISQQTQIDKVEEKVLYLEERQEELTLELVNLTKSQRHKISNKVKEAVVNSKEFYPNRSEGQLFKSFYGILKDYFKVTSYEDIPRERFREAMKVLDCMETLVLSKKLNLNQYLTVKQVKNLCLRNSLL